MSLKEFEDEFAELAQQEKERFAAVHGVSPDTVTDFMTAVELRQMKFGGSEADAVRFCVRHMEHFHLAWKRSLLTEAMSQSQRDLPKMQRKQKDRDEAYRLAQHKPLPQEVV